MIRNITILMVMALPMALISIVLVKIARFVVNMVLALIRIIKVGLRIRRGRESSWLIPTRVARPREVKVVVATSSPLTILRLMHGS